jgi:hypothetical protein
MEEFKPSEEIYEIEAALEEVRHGKVKPIEVVAKELGIVLA